MAPIGLVHRILAPSFVDGPGSRMAIFLQGCNLHCRYCHNPETQGICTACGTCIPVCPAKALSLEAGKLRFQESLCQACDRCLDTCPAWSTPHTFLLSPAELIERAKSIEPFLDGLTFSGGECTLQPDFLLEATRRLKGETGLSVLLDTNGLMDGEVLEALLPEVDGLLFDLKAMDADTHLHLTGEDNAIILRNLDHAARMGKVVEVRTVVVPGFTDSEAEIDAIARFVKTLASPVPLRLTPFRAQGVRDGGRPWPIVEPARFKDLRNLANLVLGMGSIHAGGELP